MGSKRRTYDRETKLEAVLDFLEGRLTRRETMAKHAIASLTVFERWVKAYREGGPAALESKPRGRPRRRDVDSPEPKTRERDLEAENRRLRAEVAYLKNCGPWRRRSERLGEIPDDQGAFRAGACAQGLAGRVGRAGVHIPLQQGQAGEGPYTRPELWEKAAEIFSRSPNGCGHRQTAMCLRAEEGVRTADKTVLKMMREMGIRCGVRRETDYRKYNSYRGVVGGTFENVLGRDFSAGGPRQNLGTDVTEFKQEWGKAYFAPAYDFGSKEIAAWSISQHPDMAQQREMLDMLIPKIPDGAHPAMRSDMGW